MCQRFSKTACIGVLLGLALSVGCGGNKQPLVAVSGNVSYNGKPLTFGTVLFQPEVGPAAVGEIQPDGSYRLSTYRGYDGAAIGSHRVQIMCYEAPSTTQPANLQAEPIPGRSLIPVRYTNYETSSLTADVRQRGDNYDFALIGAQ